MTILNFNRQVPHTFGVSISEQAQHSEIDRRRDIYDSHRHRVFSVAFYMTGNELEAETILKDTFIDAFERTPEPNANIVDSALIGELKHRFPLGQHEPQAVVDPAASITRRNVRRTDLEEAMSTLPPTERLVFLLRDVEGYNAADTAALLEMTPAAVSRSLISARIRMRAAISAAQAEAEAAA